jgi:hypothetical protein
LHNIEAALKKHLEPSEIKSILNQSIYLEKNILLGYTKIDRNKLSRKYLLIIRQEIKDFENIIYQIKDFSRVLCQLVDGRCMVEVMESYFRAWAIKHKN